MCIIENNRYLLLDNNNVRWIIERNVREITKKKIILRVFPVNFRDANVFSFDSSHHKPIVVCMYENGGPFWKKNVDLKLLLDDPCTFFSKPTEFRHVRDVCILFIGAWKQIRLNYSVKSKIAYIFYIRDFCNGAVYSADPHARIKWHNIFSTGDLLPVTMV